ncbi:uncharacterized protein si:ch211-67e16.4 isoform X2 [Anguilla anguilla]|uniref:uncharacterized protein si:ch211-67e16.4 isoform X2 n=1 Tax=Anguilla anguilla TaxID=7936 RepID=UPI0015A832A8|nr:uncharacterized protein si:ch211-67e16.4 isoform X2 [Anguilla anguilla]
MDVSLSVSLLRDQMGSVIEQAVTAAVETVLGEMVKVVGCKLEEYSKEMTAKEKENENIKQMLEISQCQMKTMRKYLSAVIAKDDRQVLINQRNAQKENELNRTHRLPAGQTPHFRGMKRTFIVSEKAKKPLTQSPSAYPSEVLVQAASSCDRSVPTSPGPHDLVQESATRPEREDSFDNSVPCVSKEASELSHMKECRVCPEVESGVEGKDDASEAVWAVGEQSTSQEEHAEILSPDPQSPVQAVAGAPADGSGSEVWDAPVRAKEEEAEIEIICIKEEPEDLEAYPLNPPCPDLGVEQGNLPERSRPLEVEHADELTEASLAAVASFMYPGDAHRQQTAAQRQARWRHHHRAREQSPFEDHRHRKAELKRRSQHRRREREKSLPQPLLAALERERREKNRIRVARWRAKRKLQAGLATPPQQQPHPQQPAPPFGYPPAHADKLHRHPSFGAAAPQPAALLFGGPQCEAGALFPSLQFGSGPLLPGGLRHDT